MNSMKILKFIGLAILPILLFISCTNAESEELKKPDTKKKQEIEQVVEEINLDEEVIIKDDILRAEILKSLNIINDQKIIKRDALTLDALLIPNDVNDLSGLECFKNIVALSLSYTSQIAVKNIDLSPLRNLKNLTQLTINSDSFETPITFDFNKIPKEIVDTIDRITIRNIDFKNFDVLKNTTNVTLTKTPFPLTKLQTESMQNVTKLSYSHRLEDISFLGELKNIETLYFTWFINSGKPKNTDFLSSLKKLNTFFIVLDTSDGDTNTIKKLEILKNLKNITTLQLSGIIDRSPDIFGLIKTFDHLEKIDLTRSSKAIISEAGLLELKKSLPNTNIIK